MMTPGTDLEYAVEDLNRSIVDAIRPPASVGKVARAMYRFVGADFKKLRLCGRFERGLYIVLSMALGVTITLAFIYGLISSSIYTSGAVSVNIATIVAGLFTGGCIYALERVLLAMMFREYRFGQGGPLSKHGLQDRTNALWNFVRTSALAASRLAIAVIVAAVVSDPLLLLIYRDSIDTILQSRREAAAKDLRDEIEEQYEDEIAAELPKSADTLRLETDLSRLEEQARGFDSAAARLRQSSQSYEELAQCEQFGARNEACARLQQEGDPPLTGEPRCEDRCLEYTRLAADESRKAQEETDKAQNVRENLIPAKNQEIDSQAEVEKAELSIPLDEAGLYSAVSPAEARKECADASINIEHNVISGDDPRLPFLFEYCKLDLEETKKKPLAFSDLQSQQEAFEVLTKCHDPLGLRTEEPIASEPRYCNIASGKDDAGAGEAVNPEVGNIWTRIKRPLHRVIQGETSTLSQSATRLSWLIFILDTLPIFLKWSMSLSRRRAYDAILSLERLLSINGISVAYDSVFGSSGSVVAPLIDPRRKRRFSDLVSRWIRQRRSPGDGSTEGLDIDPAPIVETSRVPYPDAPDPLESRLP